MITTTDPIFAAPPAPAADDDVVHFNQAAKALGVSRKTVERMVKRGELERDTSRDTTGQEALVTNPNLSTETGQVHPFPPSCPAR